MPRAPPELLRGRPLTRRSAGRWGEDLALQHLRREGYSLVERNYRTRYGEIDLIVRRDDTLVFVEVKLRRGTLFGDPLEAVTPRKRAKVRSLARLYLAERGPAQSTLRFDVVGISVQQRGEPRLVHLENAF